MAGFPEFEQIVAQAPKKNLTLTKQLVSASIAIGQTEVISFYAPPNKVSKVVGVKVFINKPSGTSEGYQNLYFYFGSGASIVDIMQANYNFDKDVAYYNNQFFGAAIVTPSTADVSQIAQNLTYDSVIPLNFGYENRTDVPNGQARTYTVIAVNEEVR
jgi:hypothetical protein